MTITLEKTAAPTTAQLLDQWPSSHRQMERAWRLWPGIILPDPPKPTVLTKDEKLLLHVPLPLETLLRIAGVDYDERILDENHLRYRPHSERSYRFPTWIAFDPSFGAGQRPRALWDCPTCLAAEEVISAIIQYPEWPAQWGDGLSLCLAGYQANVDGLWSHCPYLAYENGRLRLDAQWAGLRASGRTMPAVRPLN